MPERVIFEFKADETTDKYRFKVNLGARRRRARAAEVRRSRAEPRHGRRAVRGAREHLYKTLQLLEKVYSELYRDGII